MGGILSRAFRLFRGNGFINRVVVIDGIPYTLERRLGKGGFGAVFSGRRNDGMPVAVKLIDLNIMPGRNQQLVATFLNEVYLLQQLRQYSRHVVKIYGFDFDPRTGEGYIAMELGNENLGILINRLRGMSRGFGPAIDPIMIKQFWYQMVKIVRTLHANNPPIVHMDLKPENLILFGQTLKIADLGISRKANALGRARVGTPPFSAPEVMQDIPGVSRFYGPKADIWSLGAILYYMVYGVPPTYHPIAAAQPPPGQLPFPDHGINDILRRTLVIDPDLRADINTLLFHPFTRH